VAFVVFEAVEIKLSKREDKNSWNKG